MRRFRDLRLAAALIAMLALAGCASTTSPAASTNVTGSTAQSATAGSSSAASVAPSAPRATKPSVDLTFTGALAFAAKGSAGQCTLGKDAAGNVVSFGFGAVEADYPGLGEGFYVSESGSVTIKWLVGAGQGYLEIAGGSGAGVMAVSADHHSITLDTVLDGSPAPEHVAGTIVCP